MSNFCKTGKRKYLKGQAQIICDKRNLANGGIGHIYRCKVCDYWHITKKAKKWPLD